MAPRMNEGWTRSVRTGMAALATVSILALSPSVGTTADRAASDAGATVTAAGNMRFLSLGIGKSVVIDLPRDVKDVLVADPKIANAVVRSAQRAYLIGAAVGQTNVFFFDASGQQIAAYDIAVTRDLNGIRAVLKETMPDIKIEGVGDGVMLSGSVANPAEAQQAMDVATRLVGDATKVANGIVIRGRDQVMIKVTVAEVQRDVIKQLGVNISGSLNYGSAVIDFNNNTPFTAYGRALTAGNQIAGTFKSVNATLRAMERAGVVRTLAEPNLTAISGESANFLAGGEFPVPSGYTCDPNTRQCSLGVQFKKFGISLGFTPVVMSEGRISMKVATEVSELSTEDALVLTSGDSSVQIPAIKTRRADTVVEIPSGGALAMAGLIAEQTKQQVNGLPGLMQLPVLGTLFKSRDYVNRQTELMILVSPYVVRAVAQKDLSRPDDGFADASDPASAILGSINKIYGVPGRVAPNKTYSGNVGFIRD